MWKYVANQDYTDVSVIQIMSCDKLHHCQSNSTLLLRDIDVLSHDTCVL